jgi:hypothetical protein
MTAIFLTGARTRHVQGTSQKIVARASSLSCIRHGVTGMAFILNFVKIDLLVQKMWGCIYSEFGGFNRTGHAWYSLSSVCMRYFRVHWWILRNAWYDQCDNERYSAILICSYLQSEITVWRTSELVRWEQYFFTVMKRYNLCPWSSETDLISRLKSMLGNSGKRRSECVWFTDSVTELYGQKLYVFENPTSFLKACRMWHNLAICETLL